MNLLKKTSCYLLLFISNLPNAINNINGNNSIDTEENTQLIFEIYSALSSSLTTLTGLINFTFTMITILIAFLIGYAALWGMKDWKKLKDSIDEIKDELLIVESKARSAEDEINKAGKDAESIVHFEKQAREEFEKSRNEINSYSVLIDEKPTPKIRDKLDEFNRQFKFIELFGVKLTSKDYFNQGMYYYFNEVYDFSLEFFERSLENNSYERLKREYRTDALNNKGVVLSKQKKYNEAIKAYEMSLEEDSDNFCTLTNMGIVFLILSKNKDTKELKVLLNNSTNSLEKSLFIEAPKRECVNITTCLNLGIAYFKLAEIEENRQEREKYLRKSLESLKRPIRSITVSPNEYTEIYFRIGSTYAKLAETQNKKENLQNALESYEKSLKIPINQTYYAKTQARVGSAYLELANTEETEKEIRLNKALNSFQEALNIFSTAKILDFTDENYAYNSNKNRVYHLDENRTYYADVQMNLGKVYAELAEIRDIEKNLDKSLSFFTEALIIKNKRDHPGEYSQIKYRIGRAYLNLADIRDREKNLQYALTALKEALEITEKDKNDLYAQTKNSLGSYYRKLAVIRDYEINLNNAIFEYEESLKIRTKVLYPNEFAITKNNLGNVYLELSEINNEEKNINKAIEAYQEALTVGKKDEFPQKYAKIQYNLGEAYNKLADTKNNTKDKKEIVEKLIEILQDALETLDFAHYPIDYARIKNKLGCAYMILSDVEDSEKNLDIAINAFKEALQIEIKDKSVDCAKTQNNLGKAYIKLADTFDRHKKIINAVEVCKELLECIDLKDPANKLDIQDCFRDVYTKLAEIRDYEVNLKKAITNYREALKIRKKEDYPLDYAETQNNLGDAYSKLAKIRDYITHLEKAIEAYKKALEVYKPEDFPDKRKNIENKIKSLTSTT